jgi:AAA15 family ATPase/GTPase
MNVSKITVKNFRSLKNAEIVPDCFSIFVGQNNHGKTNLFEAIEWFFSGPKKGENIDEIRFNRTGSDEVSVEIEFAGAKAGAEG